MKKVKLLTTLFALYAGGVLAQNILAAKQIDLLCFTVTTGILVSPLVFIIQDVMVEVFGFKTTKRMVLTGFAVNFLFVVLASLAIFLPSAQLWTNQEAFQTILGTTFRASIASFLAYCVGSLVNAKVMEVLRKKKEKNLFFRAISSTIAGQLLDNAIFAFIAFSFVLPLPAIISMVIGGTLFETAYEVILFPVTKKAIQKAKNYIGGKND